MQKGFKDELDTARWKNDFAAKFQKVQIQDRKYISKNETFLPKVGIH